MKLTHKISGAAASLALAALAAPVLLHLAHA